MKLRFSVEGGNRLRALRGRPVALPRSYCRSLAYAHAWERRGKRDDLIMIAVAGLG
jgi:hypothetical protein